MQHPHDSGGGGVVGIGVAVRRPVLDHGDHLVDDRTGNGAADLEGELLPFGSADHPDWAAVASYLLGTKR